MLNEPAADFGRRIVRATVVSRRSGEGFRVVLGLRTAHGTPLPETLPGCFSSLDEARSYAISDLGLRPDHVRVVL